MPPSPAPQPPKRVARAHREQGEPLRVALDLPGERLVLRRPWGVGRALAPLLALPRRAWGVVAQLARSIWSDDPLSWQKIGRAIALSLLLGFCGALLALAGALLLVGVLLVGLLFHIAAFLLAWMLVRAAVRSESTPTARVSTRRDLDVLDVDRARGSLVLRGKSGRVSLSCSSVRALRLVIEPSTSGPCDLALSLDADGVDTPITTRLAVEAVDLESEAIDLGFRIARAIGLGTQELRRLPLLGVEISLGRPPTRAGGEAHPFRAGASDRRAIPELDAAADYAAVEPEPGFREPPLPLPPVASQDLRNEACELTRWRPGHEARFRLRAARPSWRDAVRGLTAGLALALVLATSVGVLGVLIAWWAPDMDPHWQARTKVLSALTLISALGGWFSSLGLARTERGETTATFDWSSESLALQVDETTDYLRFARFEELVLRVGPRWALELYCEHRGPVLLWHGPADAHDPEAPPLRLLVELARALKLPWRCEGRPSEAS